MKIYHINLEYMRKTNNVHVLFFMEENVIVEKLKGKCYRIVLDSGTIFGDSYRSLFRAYLSHLENKS